MELSETLSEWDIDSERDNVVVADTRDELVREELIE